MTEGFLGDIMLGDEGLGDEGPTVGDEEGFVLGHYDPPTPDAIFFDDPSPS